MPSWAAGGDPKAERDKLKGVPSFGDFSDAYVEAMAPSWRNPKHAAQWKMTLTVYALPIRHRPVDEITTSEVLKVLEPLWKRTPETAERLRGRIENVLNAARRRATGQVRTLRCGVVISTNSSRNVSGCRAGIMRRSPVTQSLPSWKICGREAPLPLERSNLQS